MAKALRFNKAGGPEVFELEEVPVPHPGPGEVRVRVQAAGLNHTDVLLSQGVLPQYELIVPSGLGFDFAGVVDEIGEGVNDHAKGDDVHGTLAHEGEAVLGGTRMQSVADYVIVKAEALTKRPSNVPVTVAGSLWVVASAANACVEAVQPGPKDTVLVSAAAGGVGVIAAQLAKLRGARVIGTASQKHHDFLRQIGIEPVEYGDGLVDRIRALSPEGVTKVIDTNGSDTIRAGLELGTPGDKMVTTIAFDMLDKGVIPVDIGQEGGSPADSVPKVTKLISEGSIVLPEPRVWPLEQYREAYEALGTFGGRGRIVLAISS